MIIKSSQRAGHAELAAHLVKTQDIDGTPQTVTISSSRQLPVSDNVRDALRIMQLMAKSSSRCRKDMYHISLSPNHLMNDDDWLLAWEIYEQEFGLAHQPYIEVTHDKGDRPAHRHRVYERIDVASGKAVHLSHTRVRNEKVARQIEYALGHPLTVGKHNRTVMRQLTEDGKNDVVAWMQQGYADSCPRPDANLNHAEVQQVKRSALSIEQVKAELQECFEHSVDGRSFQAAIADRSYVLARGDRRDSVIIDTYGGLHSPRRRLNQKAKVISDKLKDVDLTELPTVAEVMKILRDLQRLDDENREGQAEDAFAIDDQDSNRAA